MADYTAPAYYPYVDSPSTSTPLRVADYNPVIATLVDLAATGGRVPVIETKLATIASGATAYTDEAARDAIGTALVAGSGITITVNDGADTITVAVTGGGAGFTPSDHGFLTWSLDPALASSSSVFTAGVLQLVKVKLPVAATISNIGIVVSTAGNTLTNSYLALYDSTGTRQGVTADQSSSWTTAGVYTPALVTPYSAAAGVYYVGILVGSATTVPALSRTSTSNAINAGLTAPGLRFGTSGTGLTATPSTVTLSGVSGTTGTAFFVALK